MSITDIGMLFSFIGGLGLFLYGMNVMADGLQKSAGNKMKQLLGFLTNNRFLAVLVGTAITGIIQSSSATTVMVVGFVNAGIMNLTQAVGVIMGANIGTTVTAWIVSMSEWGAFFKPEFLAPLVVGIGSFIILFSKSDKKKIIGEIAVGFGILFIGLSMMSDSITPYKDAPIFSQAFAVLGSNPILALLAGAVVTGIIQSSSASVGILQTLAMNGIVNWKSAIFITLGQNIGTCVTALLSSAGAQKMAKRAAVIHLLFNTMGAIIFGIIMFIIFSFVPDFASSSINSVEISIFHTIFNVTNTIILFPFANQLVKLSGVIIKNSEVKEETAEKEEAITLRHLDERILESPSFAVENAILEVAHMGDIAVANTKLAFEAARENDINKVQTVFENEKTIDNLQKLITEYLVKINNLSLTEKQHMIINNLFYMANDIERVGDHAENIAELAEFKCKNNIVFSNSAQDEIMQIMDIGLKSIQNAILSIKEENIEYVRKVVKYEDMVDNMEEELREKHIERLSNNLCTPESGIVFLDIISNLERISDHAYNIAGYVKDEME
ncbi:phosphate:Na+ symporter [Lachnotalea glycerini]|uniref:Na/Pi cotransporter family protein n=1 Tax=Lachnotalea glycerini TaxID=1763509 RepID=A0A255IJA4_9FIRM|nr:Na/Pi cotransporter family protein [Lachnotalea glycerini]PXV95991.1 phosphate:Na+ symporter [Lachnotalea glycerini]RDY32964.1 Na/Pi cotransporter family protein [Lachnotalea glycerini]